MQESNQRLSIGLALSGGGVRAAAFHSGVLRFLAHKRVLEKVNYISSVSGGSLFTGLVFKLSSYKWPSSDAYIDSVLPSVKEILTQSSLQLNSIKRLVFNPLNWRYFLSRANVLSQSIQASWGIKATLGDLPELPMWSINGTTGETARRFHFFKNKMGDYKLGYTNAQDFPLASAMAVSAAYPGLVGPLSIKSKNLVWSVKPSLLPYGNNEALNSSFDRLHIYDGGIYDNLGLEPLFDAGSQEFKPSSKINYIVVSDAGRKFEKSQIPLVINPMRFKRIAEIGFEQCRALRVRALVNFLKNNKRKGLYLNIGAIPLNEINNEVNLSEEQKSQILNFEWLSESEVLSASNHPTDLNRLSINEFDQLELHGFQTALLRDEVYRKLLGINF